MANKITDKIWIGDSQDARYPPSECNSILNCANDLQPMKGWNDRIHASHCGLIDGYGNPLEGYYSAVMQLGTLLSHDKTVLVHCHAGHSRSVSVVIMYLNAVDNKGWGYWCREVCGKRMISEDLPAKAHKEAFEKMDWEFLGKILKKG